MAENLLKQPRVMSVIFMGLVCKASVLILFSVLISFKQKYSAIELAALELVYTRVISDYVAIC